MTFFEENGPKGGRVMRWAVDVRATRSTPPFDAHGQRAPVRGRPGPAKIVLGMLLCLWPSLAAAQDRPYEWGWGMHPMWGMWGIGMMLVMLVFCGMVIVGIVLAIRWLVTQGRESRATDPALDILRQRYARGDISKEEFEAKKKDLT